MGAIVDPAKAEQGRVGLTLALCFLGSLVEGYSLQSAGVAAPKFARALHLHAGSIFDFQNNLTWVLSSNALGLFIGAAIGGRLADKIGRKWILTLSMMAFALFTFGSALANDYGTMVLMRFLTGLGLGGAMPNIIAIAAETGSQKTRVARVTIITGSLPAGGALVSLFVFGAGPDLDWRNVFYLGAALPLIVSLLMAVFLADGYRPKSTEKAMTTTQALFGDKRLWSTTYIWISFFFTMVALYLLLNWLATLMNGAGYTPLQATVVTLYFGVGGAAGAWILGLTSRIISRPLILTICYLGMAASIWVLAVTDHDIASANAAAFGAGIFVVGTQALLFGMAPDYYRPEIRGAGVGWAVAMGRAGSFFGPLLPGIVGPSKVLFLLLPVIAAAGFAALLLTKIGMQDGETKGRS
ncbi:MAG TPA: MFS transporter [Caulobacteraceae bacterium]|jgi:AAHS family 3-hydroxyphenylpropionic acid transporter|nr:MFS transporter [Caulobacteraceae bacterium]